MERGFMTTAEVAEYLGVSYAAYIQITLTDGAPRRAKIGRGYRYRKEDVDAWVDARMSEAK